ncbi:hypothetical protein EV421DRAFT_1744802 [Armillaria borealis]|uniref:Uncharacterized protein n=1 Tax=Armillaria borealis TaxID=47425 RepID=A0AA39MDN4_9AGAR|nr:hypothetical protein EV421DRAFT_1744802 [Armillaria borealis]
MFAIRLTLTIVEGWQAPFNVPSGETGGEAKSSRWWTHTISRTYMEMLQENSHEVEDLVVLPVIQMLPAEALTSEQVRPSMWMDRSTVNLSDHCRVAITTERCCKAPNCCHVILRGLLIGAPFDCGLIKLYFPTSGRISEKLGFKNDVNTAFRDLIDMGRRTSVAERKNPTSVVGDGPLMVQSLQICDYSVCRRYLATFTRDFWDTACQSFEGVSGMNSTDDYSGGEWVVPNRRDAPGAQTSVHDLL